MKSSFPTASSSTGLLQIRWTVGSAREWASECTRLVSESTPVRQPQQSPKLSPVYNLSTYCWPPPLPPPPSMNWCNESLFPQTDALSQRVNKPNVLASVSRANANNGLLRWDLSSQGDISFKNCQIHASMHSHSASPWLDHTSLPYATGTVSRCTGLGRQHRKQVGDHVLSHFS